MNQRIVC